MKKVYIVTSGSYSDYGINAVFDDKELAQMFIDKQNSVENYPRDYGIEEWPVNNHEKQIRAGLSYFMVFVAFDGETSAPSAEVPGDIDVESVKIIPTMRFWSADGSNRYAEKPAIRVFCWAKNKKHALKITTDKRKELLATGEITND